MTDFHSGEPLTEHPAAEDVAAYLGERLAPEASAALEEHLTDCRECRQLVTSARRLLQSHRAPNRLVWMVPPAAAAALLAVVLLARSPGPSPVGEESLRSDPGSSLSEELPTIRVVAPADGATVGTGPLVFRWLGQPGQPLYRLSVTDAGGQQVWTTETSDITVTLPTEVSLDRGRAYFWTVDALGADGRSLTTRTKRFSTAP